ncbi:MAG: DUF58 domain-containing protein [Bacteroidota bacterium]
MFKSIYISRGFFLGWAVCTVFILLGYYFTWMLYVGQFAIIILLTLTVLDVLILYGAHKHISLLRAVPQRLDLGDASTIRLKVENQSVQPLRVTIFDTPPHEMQARDLSFHQLVMPQRGSEFNYEFIPHHRGEYEWGTTIVFIRSFLSLTQRKIEFSKREKAIAYPSVQQMKRFDFILFNQKNLELGIKKIRRLGHNNEFEQIKNYVQGDDIRTINWKATSRRSELMVNQYQAQRTQAVFSIIDKSRSMEHQFEGLTLLDHAINTTLVFSNIALRKGDKVGLFTFSDKLGSQVPAQKGGRQLQRILDVLYAQQTHFLESNFALLTQRAMRKIPSRSLLMIYTNFETELAMRRALPMLRQLNKKFVVVVVFFENTTLQSIATREPSTERDIYLSTLAEDVINIKRRIARELNRNGIQTVLTKPDQLSVNTLNKYLELKSKGMI